MLTCVTICSNFTKADDVHLKPELEKVLETFFKKMDIDGDGHVTKDEAVKFWGKNFAKVNANSMFNEVDEDGNGNVTWEEFTEFWKNVVGNGYLFRTMHDLGRIADVLFKLLTTLCARMNQVL